MRRPNPASLRRARSALIWGVVALVGSQLALIGFADVFAPEVYDPEYAARLSRLRDRHAEHPDQPLLVMIGSSRSCQLFRPETMEPLTTPDGRTVLPFNLSRFGGGPVYSRFVYGRLCRQGMTPDWLVVELMPAFFTKGYEQTFYTSVTADELGDLAAYTSQSKAVKFYAKYRYVPFRSNRSGLVRAFAPAWTIPFPVNDPNEVDRLGGEGRRIGVAMTDTARCASVASACAGCERLMTNYRIDPGADRAFRDLLTACHAAGTRVILIRTPESTAFRASYPPESLAVVEAYQAELAREFGVRVIDAREWLPDSHFQDGHHPLLAGQAMFTERLHREVLTPLVSGGFDSKVVIK